MVVHTTNFGLTTGMPSTPVCDEQLQIIINEINYYLYHFGHNWIFLSIGRNHFKKCCRSWVRVYTHLDKFLGDPRCHYSLLMSVLEYEKQKFPPGSFFAKKLKELEQLVSMGPDFSITSVH